jgi:hypothetical protein
MGPEPIIITLCISLRFGIFKIPLNEIKKSILGKLNYKTDRLSNITLKNLPPNFIIRTNMPQQNFS